MGAELTKSWKTMLLVLNRPKPARVTGSKPLYLSTWSKAVTPLCGSAPTKDVIMIVCPRTHSGFGQIVHFGSCFAFGLNKTSSWFHTCACFSAIRRAAVVRIDACFPTNQSFVGSIKNREVIFWRRGRKNSNRNILTRPVQLYRLLWVDLQLAWTGCYWSG